MNPNDFSELDAAQLYLRMVNDLDPEPFIARMAPAVKYTSHWVLEDLDDATRVAQLLRGKVRTLLESGKRDQRARLGVASTFEEGRPLALIFEGERAAAGVSFEVSEGRITQIAIGVIGVHQPQLLGEEQVERYRAYFPTSRYARRR